MVLTSVDSIAGTIGFNTPFIRGASSWDFCFIWVSFLMGQLSFFLFLARLQMKHKVVLFSTFFDPAIYLNHCEEDENPGKAKDFAIT
jgi:hypothetical protein